MGFGLVGGCVDSILVFLIPGLRISSGLATAGGQDSRYLDSLTLILCLSFFWFFAFWR